MPKLYIRLGAIKYAVYDQKKKISPKSIKVKHGFKKISITIPLKLLGNPGRVLTSAQTS